MVTEADAPPMRGDGPAAWWPPVDRLQDVARRHPVALDVLLACSLVPLTLFVGRKAVLPEFRPYLFVVGVLLIATLIFRRRFPLTVLGSSCGLAMVQGMLGPRFPPTVIAVLVAVYSVAVYSERRRALVALAVLGVLIGLEIDAITEPMEFIGRFVFISALVAAAFVFGLNVRTRRAYLASLHDRAVRAERERDQQSQIAAARERARIAREMHDIVAHSLSVMIALADGAAFAARTDPGKAESAAKHVSATGRVALDEMHRLLGVLRNSGDASPRAPQPGITQIDELVDQVRLAGLPTTWAVTGERFPLSPTVELAVYRVAQEALTNVLKHAVMPSSVRISLAYAEPLVTLEVVDDGVDARANHGTVAGHGLSGMRERAALFGGGVEAGPPDAGGWRVLARFGGGS
jgi:signal transduction histidine kinase